MNNNFIRDKLRHSPVATNPSALASGFFNAESDSCAIQILNGALVFTDLNGVTRVIAFEGCTQSPLSSASCIGEKGLLATPPWVIFFDVQSTRLEFSTKWVAYNLLISPLSQLGLTLIDRD